MGIMEDPFMVVIFPQVAPSKNRLNSQLRVGGK